MEQKTGILLEVRRFPFQFLNFQKAVVTINDQEYQVPWGNTYFELQPGTYSVSVYYPYFGRPTGKAEVAVAVPAGLSVRVVYRAPLWQWMKGTMRVHGVTSGLSNGSTSHI